jgi:hypothetical protein
VTCELKTPTDRLIIADYDPRSKTTHSEATIALHRELEARGLATALHTGAPSALWPFFGYHRSGDSRHGRALLEAGALGVEFWRVAVRAGAGRLTAWRYGDGEPGPRSPRPGPDDLRFASSWWLGIRACVALLRHDRTGLASASYPHSQAGYAPGRVRQRELSEDRAYDTVVRRWRRPLLAKAQDPGRLRDLLFRSDLDLLVTLRALSPEELAALRAASLLTDPSEAPFFELAAGFIVPKLDALEYPRRRLVGGGPRAHHEGTRARW